jgi:hypothetical protein
MSAIPASLAAKEWQPIPRHTSRNMSNAGASDMSRANIFSNKMRFIHIFM